MWSAPDASFASYEISYSTPVYSYTQDETTNEPRRIFDGVMAMDYDLSTITQYLKEAYQDTDIAVAIFEEEAPHYLIAASTGSPPVRYAVKDNHTLPCPHEDTMSAQASKECTPLRLPMEQLAGHATDELLVQAFATSRAAGFPLGALLTLNLDDQVDSTFYVSTTAVYKKSDDNLAWNFIVIMPGVSDHTGIAAGDADFSIICGVAALGTFLSLLFLALFLWNRHDKNIMYADWRFTCLFFAGCGVLNLVSFTFLGDNTDDRCILRMWSFHLCFVLAIAPLLAKCVRMRLLVSPRGVVARRRRVSHFHTFLMMLLPILIQVVILVMFHLLDPPQATQLLENEGSDDVTQHVECKHGSGVAFGILQIAYEGGLVLSGAALAYYTRDVESKFGESKQLIFSMISIFFVGAIMVVFSALIEYDHRGEKVFSAVGIFWGTAVCCCAFALPRLLTVHQQNRQKPNADMMTRGMAWGLPRMNSVETATGRP